MAKFRILSFDGGGIRGALTATLLKRLIKEYPKLIEITDLFAGTSTGSFVALGLASGLSIEEIANLYTVENAKYIFFSRHLGLFRPKYSHRNLKEVLLRVFPKTLRLMDLNKFVVIPSFRVKGSNTASWSPIFFNNFPDSNTKHATVIDVALSSSAAPIYFPSYNHHIDGGLIANNPSIAAISIAADPYYANQIRDEICLLSIGTGFNPHKIKGDTAKWGLIQWLFNKNPPFPLETIMFDGAVEADSYFSYQFLKDRFHRLNPELNKSISLDDYQQIPYLISLANNYNICETIAWIKNYWFTDSLIAQSKNEKQDFDLLKGKYWHNLINKFYK
jgi:patatin-like phospholipase/acyl hydrolase